MRPFRTPRPRAAAGFSCTRRRRPFRAAGRRLCISIAHKYARFASQLIAAQWACCSTGASAFLCALLFFFHVAGSRAWEAPVATRGRAVPRRSAARGAGLDPFPTD